MTQENMYHSDNEEDDDIGEDLDDLRRACLVSEPNPRVSYSEDEEDDLEILRIIKSTLAPSSTNLDDFEMLQSIKNQLGLSIDKDDDEDDDDAFNTLCAIRSRYSAYTKLNDVQGNIINDDSTRKNNQVHASDNETSSGILSRSNTCEHGHSLVVTVSDSEQEVHDKRATSSSFPEAAQAFVDAIRKNRSYQAFLRKKLTELESTIEQNEKHKKNVVIVKDFQASCKRITKQALSQSKDPRIELISTKGNNERKKTSSPLMLGPPENPYVAKYKMALEKHTKYSASLQRKYWTKKENEDLAKGLKQQLQETLIREAIDSDSEGDIDTILEGINNLEITPQMIRQFLPKVNWDQLDIKNRSAAECEARWMSTEDPLINNGTWTKAEDDYIRLVTKNNSFTDWLDVAVSLGTNRTPFQCLVRYQRSLNPNILERDWTKEDYNKFRSAVALYGKKDWQSVANIFQGRTGTQCSNKLKSREKKNWSLEEVQRLNIARKIFGAKNWHRIARFVPGRTGSQCDAKWKETLDPNVNRGKWTAEEDVKLIEVTKEHGYGKWVKIASYIPCRDRKQCKKRWESLNPDLMPLIKKAIQLKREATPGNFVDRESERPELNFNDFLALAKISLEQEQPKTAAPKRKYIPRQKKPDGAAKERQPKRRRKGDICENEANNAGEVRYLEWQYVKENKQREKLPNVTKKLKPRRKVSAEVPIEN